MLSFSDQPTNCIIPWRRIRRFAPRLNVRGGSKRSVYWVKNGKIKKRGGEGEKKNEGRSICFVDSTHYLNNCKLRNKYNYYCSFSIFESCFTAFFPSILLKLWRRFVRRSYLSKHTSTYKFLKSKFFYEERDVYWCYNLVFFFYFFIRKIKYYNTIKYEYEHNVHDYII